MAEGEEDAAVAAARPTEPWGQAGERGATADAGDPSVSISPQMAASIIERLSEVGLLVASATSLVRSGEVRTRLGRAIGRIDDVIRVVRQASVEVDHQRHSGATSSGPPGAHGMSRSRMQA